MLFNKKNIIVLSCISILSVVLFLTTNARRASDSHLLLIKATAQSKYLDEYLKANRLSPKVKAIILRQKMLVDDYIAVSTGSKNCRDLLQHAPTLRTGIYTLGANRKKIYCEMTVQNSSRGNVTNVISSLDVTKRRVPASVCQRNNSCVKERDFYKLITCESKNTAKHFCSFPKGIGRPIVMTNKGTRNCRERDYGFSREKGVWIRDGCSGIFKIKIRPVIEI